MQYKIILILNKNTKCRVCEEYCYKEIDWSKSIIEEGLNLRIIYKDGVYFEHERVEKIESFEKHGWRITTTKKEWFLYG